MESYFVFSPLYISYLTALRRRKLVAFIQATDIWTRLGFALLVIYIINANGYSALAGYFIGTLLLSIHLWFMYSKKEELNYIDENKDESYRAKLHDVNKYITPIRLFAIFAIISQYSDRWVILANTSEALVGIYAAIYMIANAPIMLISNITSQYISPVLFDKAGAMTRHEELKKSNKFSFSILDEIFTSTNYIEGFVSSYSFCKEIVTNLLWLMI